MFYNLIQTELAGLLILVGVTTIISNISMHYKSSITACSGSNARLVEAPSFTHSGRHSENEKLGHPFPPTIVHIYNLSNGAIIISSRKFRAMALCADVRLHKRCIHQFSQMTVLGR